MAEGEKFDTPKKREGEKGEKEPLASRIYKEFLTQELIKNMKIEIGNRVERIEILSNILKIPPEEIKNLSFEDSVIVIERD